MRKRIDSVIFRCYDEKNLLWRSDNVRLHCFCPYRSPVRSCLLALGRAYIVVL